MKTDIAIYETVFHPVRCEACETEYRWLIQKTHLNQRFYVKGFLEKADADLFRKQVVEDWKKAQGGFFSAVLFHIKEWWSVRNYPPVPDRAKYDWVVYRDHPILLTKAAIVGPGEKPGRIKVNPTDPKEAFAYFVFSCEELCGMVSQGTEASKEDALYLARLKIDNLPPKERISNDE